MNGDPMKIHLQKGATPHAIHGTRTIPFAFQEDQHAETAIEKHVNLIIHQQFAVNPLQTTSHRNDTRLDELRKIARDDSEYNTQKLRQSRIPKEYERRPLSS